MNCEKNSFNVEDVASVEMPSMRQRDSMEYVQSGETQAALKRTL